MDSRLRSLAEQLDANVIARREFLRKAAIVTGGTAAGLGVRRTRWPMPRPEPKLRVWLFKSFVTNSNDILAKQVEAWAKERKVAGRDGLGDLRRPRAEVRGRHRGGEPARHRRDELSGADALQAGAPRRVAARQGHRGRAGRAAPARRALRRVRRSVPRGGPPELAGWVLHPQGPPRRQGHQAAEALRPRRGRDGEEDAGPVQGPVGPRVRRSTAPTTATASCRTSSGATAGAPGTRTASRRSAPRSSSRTWRPCSSRWTPSRSTRSSRRVSWRGPTSTTTRPTWRASW